MRVDYARGLDAITGQAATLTRPSAATLVDSAGATVTVPHSRPRREARTFRGAQAVGLRVTTDDVTYPCTLLPESGTLLVEGVNLGTAQAANAGLLYIGRDDATGARLFVRGTGTTFAVDFFNAANEVSTAVLGLAVPNGADFQLVAQLEDAAGAMRVRLGGAVNGAAVAFSAFGTARARAAAWGTDARVRVNRGGSAGVQGNAWLAGFAWSAGALTLADVSGVL
jgi:hypothetical protein